LKGQTGQPNTIIDIEEARDWDFYNLHRLVVVEHEMIRSCDELLALAQEERFKDKDTLGVFFMITMTGGCH
jgi:hypothetical protein